MFDGLDFNVFYKHIDDEISLLNKSIQLINKNEQNPMTDKYKEHFEGLISKISEYKEYPEWRIVLDIRYKRLDIVGEFNEICSKVLFILRFYGSDLSFFKNGKHISLGQEELFEELDNMINHA